MRLPPQLRKGLRSMHFRLAHPWRNLSKRVRTVRDYASLEHALGWREPPLLHDETLQRFEGIADINHRRKHDAMVIGGACRNLARGTFLEIGTAHGRMTAIMAENAPEATIFTVNIPPEEIGQGGELTTFAPSRDEIGRVYRERGHTNVQQIFANTATWRPEIGPIDFAFIDGCHDAEFVFSDTRLVLEHARPGCVIVWHDFSPELAHVYGHLAEVCTGLDWLCQKRILSGPILHLQDSYTGLYVVREADLGGS